MQTPRQQIVKQLAIVYTSLKGMVMLALALVGGAILLPLLGINPLQSPVVAGMAVLFATLCFASLYFIQRAAHKAVARHASLTDVLINSLGQGFLTFDAKGICGMVYSQACCDLFGTDVIAGKAVATLLNVAEAEKAVFQEWLDVMFMPGHALSFDDAARFLPERFIQKNGAESAGDTNSKTITLSYRPVWQGDGTLRQVVLIATDKTEEMEAQKRANAERQFAAMVCAVVAERQAFSLTMAELQALIDCLANPDKQGQKNIFGADFFRDVHTLKGAALHFKMDPLGLALHELETTLQRFKDNPAAALREEIEQRRVEVQLAFGRVQYTMRDIFGDETKNSHGVMEVDEDAIYEFNTLLQQREIAPDICAIYHQRILCVPLFSLLQSLDRQMLAVAEKLEKKVKPIVFKGKSVPVSARLMQHLVMAFTHVVHNILDHGIETPIARMAKGKDPYGEVCIAVDTLVEDGKKWIQIVIADDGAGIDPNKVRAKLAAVDPQGNWRFENDVEVVQQLLLRELSTKDEVSMLSGRGAGMSSVYQEVLRLGGRTTLRSEMHRGTTLTIWLPEKLPEKPELLAAQ